MKAPEFGSKPMDIVSAHCATLSAMPIADLGLVTTGAIACPNALLAEPIVRGSFVWESTNPSAIAAALYRSTSSPLNFPVARPATTGLPNPMRPPLRVRGPGPLLASLVPTPASRGLRSGQP